MSGSALCSPSCVFKMIQDTPYTSPEWLLAIYIPSISVARLPLLHGQSCISGFDTFLQHGPFARWEARLLWSADLPFHVAWLAKRAYAFFPEYTQEKTIRPFWPTKQPGKANQRSKEVSLPSGQKGHVSKKCQNQKCRTGHGVMGALLR